MNPNSSVDLVRERRRGRFSLWIPWLLIWVLMLPFVILFTPFVFVVCLVGRVDAVRGVGIYWQLFGALRGLRVEVEDPGARIRIL